MKILVDADACPVKKEIIVVAKELNLIVKMFIDTSHQLQDDYSEVIMVDKAADAVDFALIKHMDKGDVVITQDYGVATMTLAKGGYALNQDGILYDKNNIDELLFRRYLSSKIRRSGGKAGGPKKRNKDDNIRFEVALRNLCKAHNLI